MCFDCWAGEWASMIQVLARGGNWQQIDSALFLLCQGFSYQEAADLAGICRRSLDNWIRQARQRPEMAPDWLVNRAAARQLARL
jgi:transposase-like protein